MKSYFFLPKCNMRGNIRAHTLKKIQKKKREKSRERERTKTHCRTRGWWSIVVVSLVLFAVSVISLVYFKRENERGKYYSSTYITRGFWAFLLVSVAKKKKEALTKKKRKKTS